LNWDFLTVSELIMNTMDANRHKTVIPLIKIIRESLVENFTIYISIIYKIYLPGSIIVKTVPL